ncbi:MAG: NAD(P)-binding domain-containing protein [Oscillospiraceae bacterium]
MKIGVIGVGIITTNVIESFLDFGESKDIFYLSPRNKQRCEMLLQKYPQNIIVCQENQQVLDNADYIILGLLTDTANEILPQLKFKKEHKVINFIATIGLPKLKEMIGETKLLCDVVPLPCISKRMGPILLYPVIQEMIDFFSPMGKVIALNSEYEMDALRCTTALMSPFYELVYSVVDWNIKNGLTEKDSKAFTTAFFDALCKMAADTKENGLKELAEEMTPGGLNYQTTQHLLQKNAFNEWQVALDAVKNRVDSENKK